MTAATATAEPVRLPTWAAGLFLPCRYKVLYGGRGSGKTWAISTALVMQAAAEPLRIACVRETQKSIQESAKRTIEHRIRALGLSGFFEVQQYRIICKNGSLFFFSGLATATEEAVRGWEAVDRVWFEEAHRMSQRSREILYPTIRKPGSQLWFSFNPQTRQDPVYRDFVTNVSARAENAYVRKVNFSDNPWFPDELDEERRVLLELEPERYAHVWLGEPDDEGAFLKLISPMRVEMAFDAYKPEYAVGKPVAGLDVADSVEGDWNAFCIRRGPVVTHLERWRASDVGVTARRAHSRCLEHGVALLAYDVGGVGSGVKAVMNEVRPDYLVRPIHFGGKVERPDRKYQRGVTNRDFFKNRKSQLGWALRLRGRNLSALVKDGNDQVLPETCLYFAPDALKRLKRQVVVDEMSRAQWEEDLSGRIRIVKDPDEQGSPDLFDAVSLAFQGDSRGGLTG